MSRKVWARMPLCGTTATLTRLVFPPSIQSPIASHDQEIILLENGASVNTSSLLRTETASAFSIA
jgi:hypothetical protein